MKLGVAFSSDSGEPFCICGRPVRFCACDALHDAKEDPPRGRDTDYDLASELLDEDLEVSP